MAKTAAIDERVLDCYAEFPESFRNSARKPTWVSTNRASTSTRGTQMIRLTLRTLLAYLDDTLPAAESKVIGHKFAESKQAMELVDQIKKVIRKRSLSTPPAGAEGGPSDPNTVAAYLSDNLTAEQVTAFENLALESDVHLADVAACHQILTMLLSEQVRVPPSAYRRMYGLVKGPESLPERTPGRLIPVGGVVPSDNSMEAIDADAQFLLGMSPYSRSQPLVWRVGRWVAAALLAVGFGLTAWLAWPKSPPVVATIPPNREALKPIGNAPEVILKVNEPAQVEMEPKPVEAPEKSPVEVVTPPQTEPMPKLIGPMPKDAALPEVQKIDRQAIGKLDSPDDRVLMARKAESEIWNRVTRGGSVFSSDKLICPPGFTAKVAFETGVVAELWGNVFPDLLPLPIYDAAMTAAVSDGYEADFLLHTGRVYLTTSRMMGAKIRVRTVSETWDIFIPDRTSEVVLQIVKAPEAGPSTTPRVTLIAFVLQGSATINVKAKAHRLAAGECLETNNKDSQLIGPKKPDRAPISDPLYFAKLAVYPNAKLAQPMRKSLDQFAERLKTAKSVSAAFAELRSEPMAPPTVEDSAGYRFAILSAAAMGDLGVLADCLNDANRQDVRQTAVFGLQHLLSSQPELETKFRAVALDKLRLSDSATTDLLRTLRGLTEVERTDRATLTKLAEQLNSSEIASREVALFTLAVVVDPTSATRPGLLLDTAASEEIRKAAVEAWRKRIDELAKSMQK
jgi:hypothetical protein